MAPSTSSFLDLKAQLSKQEADFAQNRALGKEMVVKGGVKRADKVRD
jgi:coiled-coil domain-containing protein 174